MDVVELFERYSFAVIKRDIDMFMDCIADDAEFLLPDGRLCKGREEIRNVHAHFFSQHPPIPKLRKLMTDGLSVACEIQLPDSLPHYFRASIWVDFNEDGKVVRQHVYMITVSNL